MKATINKREVMNRAWAIFRMSNGYSYRTQKYSRMIKSFAECLKNAWMQIKLSFMPEPAMSGQAAYYNENRRYYGD